MEDNLRLCAEMRGLRLTSAVLEEALARVGLPGFHRRWPVTLSGGEQQRVAIARALVSKSEVILADEPTGALDADNSAAIAELLLELGRSPTVTVVVATHDRDVADAMPVRAQLVRGRLRFSEAATG